MTAPVRTLRCAVYTRKSSEEGLDQAFNSLDAQRQAGLDYIASQRGQGWVAIKTAYDDGGYSGGTTDRPALQSIIADIRARRIDVVVVYKVDRLSRSLTDFARLMQLFDEHGVSFVSVTQQFSTTTSMGRLTLNMLLSFAQFEREVAGERIRDKIAATFRRGVFVTGQPPIGYRRAEPGAAGHAERTLVTMASEAATVRSIFNGYLELGSLVQLAQRLNAAGHRTKAWTSSRGRSFGGKAFCTTLLHRILTNPIYLGKVAHTRPVTGPGGRVEMVTDLFDGLHQPIIDRDLWDRVQAAMQNVQRAERASWNHTHLLKGRLFTCEGAAMSPTSVQKRVVTAKTGVAVGNDQDSSASRKADPHGPTVPRRLIFYYVSQRAIKHGYASCPVKSVNARLLDDLIRSVVCTYAGSVSVALFDDSDEAAIDAVLRTIVHRVTVGPLQIKIEMDQRRFELDSAGPDAAASSAHGTSVVATASKATSGPFEELKPKVCINGELVELTLDLDLKRLDARRIILARDRVFAPSLPGRRPTTEVHLSHAIGQAFAWHERLLKTREPIEHLARSVNLSPARIKHLLTLTHLSPEILRAALTGTLPSSTTLDDLIDAGRRLDWVKQAERLSLPARS